MDDIRIDSQGFRVGRWSFPPFVLRRGQRVALNLPQEGIQDHDRLVAALTGSEIVPGLALHGSVVFARSALGPTGWRRWLRDPTAFGWLKTNTSLADDAILAILNEHAIDREIPLNSFAGTPRSILGLYAALARKPGAIVYTSSGLDPLGKLTIHQIVARHLSECAAVYLGWPYACQGQEQRDELPGATWISITECVPTLRSSVPAGK